MGHVTDHDLDDALRLLLVPASVEPTQGELVALTRAVGDLASVASTRAVPRRRRLATRSRWLPVIALAGSTALGGTAFAVGGVPAPLRGVAHAIGLPVHTTDGPASHELARLRAALERGDPAAIRAAAARLRVALDRLDPASRDAIAADAGTLLAHADDITAAPPPASGPEPTTDGSPASDPHAAPAADDPNGDPIPAETAPRNAATDPTDPAASPQPSDTPDQSAPATGAAGSGSAGTTTEPTTTTTAPGASASDPTATTPTSEPDPSTSSTPDGDPAATP